LQASTSGSGGTGNDLGWLQTSSPFHVYCGYNYALGQWSSPKSLGLACGRPGAASCGEPIDLGSGNMFYQVEDYATAGQNPLAFTRYYNSLATPDTYATTLGQNWCRSRAYRCRNWN
jgi:Domain of unknown function (DUF6531)